MKKNYRDVNNFVYVIYEKRRWVVRRLFSKQPRHVVGSRLEGMKKALPIAMNHRTKLVLWNEDGTMRRIYSFKDPMNPKRADVISQEKK